MGFDLLFRFSDLEIWVSFVCFSFSSFVHSLSIILFVFVSGIAPVAEASK